MKKKYIVRLTEEERAICDVTNVRQAFVLEGFVAALIRKKRATVP